MLMNGRAHLLTTIKHNLCENEFGTYESLNIHNKFVHEAFRFHEQWSSIQLQENYNYFLTAQKNVVKNEKQQAILLLSGCAKIDIQVKT